MGEHGVHADTHYDAETHYEATAGYNQTGMTDHDDITMAAQSNVHGAGQTEVNVKMAHQDFTRTETRGGYNEAMDRLLGGRQQTAGGWGQNDAHNYYHMDQA